MDVLDYAHFKWLNDFYTSVSQQHPIKFISAYPPKKLDFEKSYMWLVERILSHNSWTSIFPDIGSVMAEQIKYYKHSYLALFSLKSNNNIFEKKTLFLGTFSEKFGCHHFRYYNYLNPYKTSKKTNNLILRKHVSNEGKEIQQTGLIHRSPCLRVWPLKDTVWNLLMCE